MRRLLLTLGEPPERRRLRLGWSAFRRRHQARAKRCHAARRAASRPPPAGPLRIRVLPASGPTLGDAQWARIAPVVPPQRPPTGRPALDHRTILGGILWVVRTGASWRELPARYGSWHTIRTRYDRWRRDGTWARILEALAPPDAGP